MMTQATLRPIEMSDLDNMMSWVNDTTVVGKFAKLKKEITREEELVFLENIIASESDKLFAIQTENGTYLGNIGIHEIKNGEGRLALIIGNKDYWGQGYAQNAMYEIQRVAFDELNMFQLWLVVLEGNKKGQHIYKKAGFQQDAVLKDHYFVNGKHHDMIKMSISEQEYFGRRAA